MKKIKSYITNLPKGVKLIVSINLVVYFFIVVLKFFSINLISFFSEKATNDPNFRIYQVLTSMFTHDFYFTHILSNLIVFLIFSPRVEQKLGFNKFLLLYILSGVGAFILSDYFLRERYSDFMLQMSQLNSSDSILVELKRLSLETNFGKNSSIGASGAISGIVMYYLLSNLFVLRKIIYNLIIVMIVVTSTMIAFSGKNDLESIGQAGHVGGFIIGLITFLFFSIRMLLTNKINKFYL